MDTDILQPSEEYGYVYILENKWMPNLVKIGITGNITERIKTLSNQSNIPETFTAKYVSKVKADKKRDTEDALHAVFSDGRVNPKREFFLWDEAKDANAIKILKLVEVENVTDEVNSAILKNLPREEVIAMESNDELVRRAKRPNLDFFVLGIKKDEHLYFRDDPTKFVTVTTERKVIYNGQPPRYLTPVTQEILDSKAPLQPAPYWLYKGRSLQDIYNEFYQPTDGTEEKDDAGDEGEE